MRIGATIYEEAQGMIVSNFVCECIGLKGIWALWGKKTEEEPYCCLNVGKCVDIGNEILLDLGYMHSIPFREDGTKKYISQFKRDSGIKYIPGQTKAYLYPYIASEYSFIKFTYVCDSNDKNKEKKFAEEEQALFWRNGGSYLS